MKENGREENSMISAEEIQKILNDYRIGKKPLAKLLGWGETTIIRYIEGDVPTWEYSDRLKDILENPIYYYEILLKNKDNLTNVAYRKSRQAVLAKIMESKIHVTAQYIINQCGGRISSEELIYLLYYVQGFSIAFQEIPVFADEYVISGECLPYPVFYNEIKSRNLLPLEIHSDLLTSVDKDIIKGVMKAFRWYGLRTLETMVAFERTMMRASKDRDDIKIISKEAMGDYFSDVIRYYNIAMPDQIEKYPDRRIVDIKNLAV